MRRSTSASTLLLEGAASVRKPADRRFLGVPLVLWITLVAIGAVLSGGGYSVWLARNDPPAPQLPAGPPQAVSLSRSSTTDMLDGNFITTTALYRSSEAPPQVIAFYQRLLAKKQPQFGQFNVLSTTADPSNTPGSALQYIPPVFTSPTSHNKYAARYVYTEYSSGQDDVAVAIDMRHANGPTLVYMEMLTLPS